MHGAHLVKAGAPYLAKSTSVSEASPKIRPGAGGHRFGPDLQCGECGRNWDEHQRDPQPCNEAPRRSVTASDPARDRVERNSSPAVATPDLDEVRKLEERPITDGDPTPAKTAIEPD